MRKMKWLLKQLLPFSYFSEYGENGKKKVCYWKMWVGKCYNIKEYTVL